MKKLIILAAALILAAAPITANAQSYTRQGKTFRAAHKVNTKAEPTLTTYKWQDSKGHEYPIYQSPSGACFVLRTSAKTGKEYKQYLPKEVSAEIARETGVKYEPKSTQSNEKK